VYETEVTNGDEETITQKKVMSSAKRRRFYHATQVHNKNAKTSGPRTEPFGRPGSSHGEETAAQCRTGHILLVK